MAQVTQLSTLGAPGRVQSFVAKTAASPAIAGLVTCTITLRHPEPTIALRMPDPDISLRQPEPTITLEETV